MGKQFFTCAATVIVFAVATSSLAAAPDYAGQVAPLFKKYCVGCHNDGDREGKFSLESYASLQAGTPHGPALLPGDAAGSRMIQQLTGAAKPTMPPKDEPQPSAAEIALIKAWIDAGAPGPSGQQPDRFTLVVPKVAGHARVRPVAALDLSPDGKLLAVARYEEVELYPAPAGDASADGALSVGPPQRVLSGFPGKVTAVHFARDGARLVTASGIPGLGGVAAIWNLAEGSLVREFKGHRDALYDAELSPDGQILATASYDKKIQLWNAADGQPLRTLEGHNGAVYDIAFSPDGTALVSSSADDTCKVWRVSDGTRLDTLPQPLKEEYCCAFSPDGRTIVAGGADQKLRVWKFVSRDKAEINPMVRAPFAHEGTIVRMAFTPDGSRLVSVAEDRTIKVWETTHYTELQLWEHQPDVAAALAVAGDGRTFCVGRLDGSLARYPLPPASRVVAVAEAAPGPVAAAESAPAAEQAAGAAESKPAKFTEQEPNDVPAKANKVTAPVEISGVIAGGKDGNEDLDLYRFSAKAGQQWVVEVNAARAKSPLDSFVEVLDAGGERIERVLLQAVRDSYFTFRGKNDTETGDFRVFNWEEMRLNEFLYANGEVVKLWLYPRGPDSGFVVYPGQGSRWGYFDTTPLAHALGEPCYIVQPHPPGAKLIPNGLPVFPIYYENDDESHRQAGKDSRLSFTAPADGEYLVRIRDVRGLQGPDYKYTLTIRPRRPDFEVKLAAADMAIGPGSAKEFKLTAKRMDDYDGPIRVDLEGLPPGFHASTPLVIEAGQVESLGVVTVDRDAAKPAAELAKASKVTASATIDGRQVSHPVNNLGELKLGDKPKLSIEITPAPGGAQSVASNPGGPPEFEIHPGETIMVRVHVERTGHKGNVPFGGEGSGRNLPFGVYVDNIGLNGLLILEDQDERTFFITADRAAAVQTRPFHLNSSGVSSGPILLHVRPRESDEK